MVYISTNSTFRNLLPWNCILKYPKFPWHVVITEQEKKEKTVEMDWKEITIYKFANKNNYIQILIINWKIFMPEDIHQFRHVFLKSAYFVYSHSLISAPPNPAPGARAHPWPPSYATVFESYHQLSSLQNLTWILNWKHNVQNCTKTLHNLKIANLGTLIYNVIYNCLFLRIFRLTITIHFFRQIVTFQKRLNKIK